MPRHARLSWRERENSRRDSRQNAISGTGLTARAPRSPAGLSRLVPRTLRAGLPVLEAHRGADRLTTGRRRIPRPRTAVRRPPRSRLPAPTSTPTARTPTPAQPQTKRRRIPTPTITGCGRSAAPPAQPAGARNQTQPPGQDAGGGVCRPRIKAAAVRRGATRNRSMPASSHSRQRNNAHTTPPPRAAYAGRPVTARFLARAGPPCQSPMPAPSGPPIHAYSARRLTARSSHARRRPTSPLCRQAPGRRGAHEPARQCRNPVPFYQRGAAQEKIRSAAHTPAAAAPCREMR